jgi:hypothetical protein
MGPIVNASILFFPAAFKHFDASEGMLNLRAKFYTAMVGGAFFWPLIDFCNYQFNVKHMRQPFVDFVAFFYGMFLSYLSNRAINKG